MTHKNARGYWFQEKHRSKFAETGPEMQVKAILENLQQRMGFTFKHGTQAFPLTVICKEEAGEQQFDLHPDFIVSRVPNGWGQPQVAIEVDGVYHFTDHQEKKRRWRDSLLLSHGFDVIHIDARLTAYSQRPYLTDKLGKAIDHGSPVELIYA